MNLHLPTLPAPFTRPLALLVALVSGLALAVGLLAAPTLLRAAPAANICVGAGETYTTIQAAVNAAQPGDNLRVKSQVFNENVVITKSLGLYGGYTLIGCGGTRTPRNTTIDGGLSGHAINVSGSNVQVTIDGFTIRRAGAGSQGIRATGGSGGGLTVHDNFVHNNLGGGVYADYGQRATVLLSDNLVYSNTAANAAGVYAYVTLSATLVITNNQIISNAATSSQGGFDAEAAYASRLVFSNNQVLSNTAGSDFGGGLASWYANGTGAFDGNTFTSNRANGGSYGGAYLDVSLHSAITFHSNTFTRNRASSDYGGLYLVVDYQSTGVGGNLLLDGNQAGGSYGGGYVYVEYAGSALLPNTQVVNNTADASYGGAYFYAYDHSRIDLPDLYFYNNRAGTGYGAGGLDAADGNDILLAPGAQVISNTALNGDGGGLYLDLEDGGLIDLTGSAFLSNTAHGSSPEGGGAYVSSLENGSRLLLADSLFAHNTVSGTSSARGGGLYFSNGPTYGSQLDLRRVQFLTNTARGGSSASYGGGLYLGEQYYNMFPDGTYTSTLLMGAVFRNNRLTGASSVYGGGAYIYDFEEGAAVDLAGTLFASNTASSTVGSARGGGLYLGSIYEGAGARLDGSVFSGNVVTTTATGQGGGLYVDDCYSGCVFIFRGGSFTNNFASDDGGGMYWYEAEYGSYAYFEDLTFNANTALQGDGGGFYADSELAYDGSYATFLRNTVTNNRAGGDGGGVYIYDAAYDGGVVYFNDNTITGNVAGDGGGGAYFDSYSAYDGSYLEFRRNVVTDNRADGGAGGGAYLALVQYGSRLWLSDNDISRNVISSTSGYDGGGLYLGYFDEGSTLTMTNNTLNDNVGTNYGGGLYLDDGTDYGAILLIADNDLLRNRTRGNYGGGCYIGDLNDGSFLTFSRNRVNDNVAEEVDGGGCYFDGIDGGSALYAADNEFNRNTAGADTGGVVIYSSSDGAVVEFTNNSVISNRAGITASVVLAGGNYAGLYLDNSNSYFEVRGNQILSNTAYPDADGNQGDYGGVYLNTNGGLTLLAANTLHGNAAATVGALGVDAGSDSVTALEDNLIRANTAVTTTGGVQLADGSSGDAVIFLRRNRIEANTLTGSGLGAAVTAEGNPGDDPLAFWIGSENNLIAGNSDGGVLASNADWHSRNDTVADNGAYGYAYTGTLTTTLRLVNNIVWGQTADFSDFSPSVTPVFTATYSILDVGTLGEPTNLSTDPLFVGSGSYKLQSSSPAVDSANTAAAPGEDLEHTPRPYGPQADRGAYEFSLTKLYLPIIGR